LDHGETAPASLANGDLSYRRWRGDHGLPHHERCSAHSQCGIARWSAPVPSSAVPSNLEKICELSATLHSAQSCSWRPATARPLLKLREVVARSWLGVHQAGVRRRMLFRGAYPAHQPWRWVGRFHLLGAAASAELQRLAAPSRPAARRIQQPVSSSELAAASRRVEQVPEMAGQALLEGAAGLRQKPRVALRFRVVRTLRVARLLQRWEAIPRVAPQLLGAVGVQLESARLQRSKSRM